MKLNHPFINKLGGLLGSLAIRSWMSTLDYKAAYYDHTVDPISPQCRGQKIHIFWHEYILFPIYLRGHCNLSMLLSRHQDAEILSHAAYHLGFDFVRGSTNRGGSAAIRELLRKSRNMHLTITPDGPRGPRRRLAPGPIYLASKLGLPLVATGYGYDRPWRLRSWDRFAIPRPFSRARAVPSPEIFIPPDLDRAGLEHFRVKIERLMNRLTLEAESWAQSRTRKLNQFRLGRRFSAPLSHTIHTPTKLAGPHWGKNHRKAESQHGSSLRVLSDATGDNAEGV
ncbi:MAG TPA: lysophospholipid acyltransferase family protein [Thermoguttaceae bacterium]|nr:lysophospholipid acyltransferase family protein [Thermoguttaceae bacterium]